MRHLKKKYSNSIFNCYIEFYYQDSADDDGEMPHQKFTLCLCWANWKRAEIERMDENIRRRTTKKKKKGFPPSRMDETVAGVELPFCQPVQTFPFSRRRIMIKRFLHRTHIGFYFSTCYQLFFLLQRLPSEAQLSILYDRRVKQLDQKELQRSWGEKTRPSVYYPLSFSISTPTYTLYGVYTIHRSIYNTWTAHWRKKGRRRGTRRKGIS